MVVMLLVEILLFNHINLQNGTETVRSCYRYFEQKSQKHEKTKNER